MEIQAMEIQAIKPERSQYKVFPSLPNYQCTPRSREAAQDEDFHCDDDPLSGCHPLSEARAETDRFGNLRTDFVNMNKPSNPSTTSNTYFVFLFQI